VVNGTDLSESLQALLDDLVGGQPNVRNGVLLVEGPGFKWKGASGLADQGGGIPMHPDDQFNIDSIAKMMTATIVLKLTETRELGLNHPICRYLPDSIVDGLHLYQGRSYAEEITLRHLLSHTSGIADNWAHPDFLSLIIADPQRRWTPEETIEFVKDKCQPAFPPGGGFLYSDVGYNLLGLIIENVTGRPLHEVFRTALFDPMGLDHTYRPSHEQARPSLPGRAPSQRFLGDKECTLLPAVMTADWAGGGLISTTEDLNRFLRRFVQNHIFEEPSTKDTMFTWTESGPFHNYGLGVSRVLFDRSEAPQHSGLGEIWGHIGSSDNFIFYWPDRNTTMVGTLNQIECAWDLYDNLASIMKTVLKHAG
jgi:CubicO group peptidase (beta-lactamase class C family)